MHLEDAVVRRSGVMPPGTPGFVGGPFLAAGKTSLPTGSAGPRLNRAACPKNRNACAVASKAVDEGTVDDSTGSKARAESTCRSGQQVDDQDDPGRGPDQKQRPSVDKTDLRCQRPRRVRRNLGHGSTAQGAVGIYRAKRGLGLYVRVTIATTIFRHESRRDGTRPTSIEDLAVGGASSMRS